jgi:hypothetical protein
MAFLDALVRALDGCGTGMLEVMTIFFDISAIAVGIRIFRTHRHAAEKLAHDPKAHVKRPVWWPIAVLTTLAVLFTILTVYKLTRNV